jgi:hypothetical protein
MRKKLILFALNIYTKFGYFLKIVFMNFFFAEQYKTLKINLIQHILVKKSKNKIIAKELKIFVYSFALL